MDDLKESIRTAHVFLLLHTMQPDAIALGIRKVGERSNVRQIRSRHQDLAIRWFHAAQHRVERFFGVEI